MSNVETWLARHADTECGEWLSALGELSLRDHEFLMRDVAELESYWFLGEGDATHAGFVVKLRDGRRAYLDYVHADFGHEEWTVQMTAKPLDADKAFPDLGKNDGPARLAALGYRHRCAQSIRHRCLAS